MDVLSVHRLPFIFFFLQQGIGMGTFLHLNRYSILILTGLHGTAEQCLCQYRQFFADLLSTWLVGQSRLNLPPGRFSSFYFLATRFILCVKLSCVITFLFCFLSRSPSQKYTIYCQGEIGDPKTKVKGESRSKS